jgi:mono/diheme cytochrome c family protein
VGRVTGAVQCYIGPMILLAAAMAITASNGARADATKGEMLAVQLCAGCHAIKPGQNSPKPDAAPFATIVAKDSYNIFTLQSFLRTPHWTSANLSLKPDDNEAIASYIMSLRPAR